MSSETAPYSVRHERANVATHLAGFIFGLVSVPLLVRAVVFYPGTTAGQVAGAIAYGMGFLMVFGFSSLYHYHSKPRTKGIMKVWDHISIYYLIAGTYTPLLLAYAAAEDAQLMLRILWGLAGAGTLFKIFFTGRFRLVSTLIYLAMGWLVVLSPQSFQDNLPYEQLCWIAAGGACYSIGVVFYLVKSIPWHHAIWHVWVLGGALCHFTAIYLVFAR
jgi:hemolysin III